MFNFNYNSTNNNTTRTIGYETCIWESFIKHFSLLLFFSIQFSAFICSKFLFGYCLVHLLLLFVTFERNKWPVIGFVYSGLVMGQQARSPYVSSYFYCSIIEKKINNNSVWLKMPFPFASAECKFPAFVLFDSSKRIVVWFGFFFKMEQFFLQIKEVNINYTVWFIW